MERTILGYAGGFDVAGAVASLKARGVAEVVTVTMDLGQAQVLEELRDRALAAGAVRAHVLDLRETFATQYVLPSLKADALDAAGAPMPSALARALVADKLVEMARIEQADGVAHGSSTADGQDAMLDRAIAAVDPRMPVLGVALAASLRAPARLVGANLWGRIAARSADEAAELPETLYPGRRALAAAPAEPATLEVMFERGVPVAVNGVPMPLVELIATVSQLAHAHGVGRIVLPHAIVDAPAAVVLHAAHRAAASDRRRDRERAAREYAAIIAAGEWRAPARAALDRHIEKWEQRVNGSVRIRVFRGEYEVLASDQQPLVRQIPNP